MADYVSKVMTLDSGQSESESTVVDDQAPDQQ